MYKKLSLIYILTHHYHLYLFQLLFAVLKHLYFFYKNYLTELYLINLILFFYIFHINQNSHLNLI